VREPVLLGTGPALTSVGPAQLRQDDDAYAHAGGWYVAWGGAAAGSCIRAGAAVSVGEVG
jgi:hypothetical protein